MADGDIVNDAPIVPRLFLFRGGDAHDAIMIIMLGAHAVVAICGCRYDLRRHRGRARLSRLARCVRGAASHA